MSKTHMTAEQFEQEVERLQIRCDKAAFRISKFLMEKTKALHDQLDDDQKERVMRRFQAKVRESQRKIIMPPSRFSN